MHSESKFGTLKSLIESLPGYPLVNTATENEHVPQTERQIMVMKERCRDNRHILPFQHTPKILTTHIVLNMVKMLKLFPTKGRNIRKSQPQYHHVILDLILQKAPPSTDSILLSCALGEDPTQEPISQNQGGESTSVPMEISKADTISCH